MRQDLHRVGEAALSLVQAREYYGGRKFKLAVEKNTMYILDDDGKQLKAGIRKVKSKEAK